MSSRWTLESIPWDRFEPEKVDHELLETVKAAALVEANSPDYVTYLCNIFADDTDFQDAVRVWGVEEEQHGAALGRWAEMADSDFSFRDALEKFRKGYQLPLDATESVRWSEVGELISRCVVETGTSSFYSAIRDATDEPVLKEICRQIATDEFFHYRLFEKHRHRYTEGGSLTIRQRLKVAFGRVAEAEDDELAYAFYAANVKDEAAHPYDRQKFALAYWRRAMSLYQFRHIETAAKMILRAADIKSEGWFGKLSSRIAWWVVCFRTSRLKRASI